MLSLSDPDILNGVYMSEALNPVFVENFQRDPTLTWQYFGSSTGFFRIYPGEDTGWHLCHLWACSLRIKLKTAPSTQLPVNEGPS
jgi:hypothetical protein